MKTGRTGHKLFSWCCVIRLHYPEEKVLIAEGGGAHTHYTRMVEAYEGIITLKDLGASSAPHPPERM